jgi:hypothetical protein
MIYVIDTGYSGKHLDVQANPDTVGHGTAMINLIKVYAPVVKVECLSITELMNKRAVLDIFDDLKSKLLPHDIVLIPWVVGRDHDIDQRVNALARDNVIVCSAGNFSSSVDLYSPAGASGVITVGCLNKTSNLASMSNYGSESKEIAFMYGTSIHIDSIHGVMNVSGTSASASIYAALLSRVQPRNREKFIKRVFGMMTRKYRSELGI